MMPVNVTIFRHILLAAMAGMEHLLIDMLHLGEGNFIDIVFHMEAVAVVV